MKTNKISVLLVMAMVCGMAMAQQDDYKTLVRVKLSTKTAVNTLGKPYSSPMYVYQDAAYDAKTYDKSREVASTLNEGLKNVTIWAIAPYGNMQTVCTDNIVGTYLGIKTSSEDDTYVLSFDYHKGDVLYLKDKVTGKEFPCTASYSFTASKSATITDRFVFVTPSTPLPTEYEICYRNGYLEISNYPTDRNTNHIVIRDENNAIVKDKNGKDIDVAPLVIYQEIDLRHLTSGHYTIEANGEILTIGVK